MARGKIRITSDGLAPHNARVWLNDVDISSMLKGITLKIGHQEVNQAEISVFVDSVEIDAEALALLEAHVRKAPEGADEPVADVSAVGDKFRRYVCLDA